MQSSYPNGFGNEILYAMCRQEPKHIDPNVVSGKVWLIGRAYAAAIERGAGSARERGGNDIHESIAPAIVDSDLDKWIEAVADIRKVEFDNLQRVLSIHKKFIDLLKVLTKRDRRSFASKYLHFHNPLAFFIYDSRAESELRKQIDRKNLKQQLAVLSTCTEFDKTYAKFVVSCFAYQKQHDVELTPRELDRRLLKYKF